VSTSSQVATETVERVTWHEICERYPDQWVTLVDIAWVNETDFEFDTAIAIGHGARRKDALAQARALLDRYPGFGCYFTGRIRGPQRDYATP
jgi:hypothetical protein